MLSKRYAYLVVSSTLYSMIKFDSVLTLPMGACTLSNERKLCVQAAMCSWREAQIADRDQWRENVLGDLFAGHITPFIGMLQKTSRVPSTILWENVAVRINSTYRKLMKNKLNHRQMESLYSDFYFLKKAGGDLFGLKENPIKNYLKIGEELSLNPSRKTCCLYQKLEKDVEGIGYCANFPVRNKQEKMERHRA
nr:IucA/IucC family C-terminal-domain containing protein [Terrihalobacillus insolitus]